ncbi:hypothetical protein HZC31_04540 [Candidatus Woesearchaeota archaeon]|nr:hypothetical protein [Candidatus Woesearchaeota archaeon]
MTDDPESITAEIVTSTRPIDRVHRKRVLTEEEFREEEKREEAFFRLQRELFKYCTGGEMGVLRDYEEAGGLTGVFALAFGKRDLEGLWVLENILGEEGERYNIDKNTEKGKAMIRENLLFYQEDILFAHYNAVVRGQDGTNFYVVRKSTYSRREKAAIIARADEVLRILEYGEEWYKRELKHNPWEPITKMIQEIVAQTEPMIERPYIKTGIVLEWVNRDPEGYHPAGLMIEPMPNTDEEENVFLDNIERKEGERMRETRVRFLDEGPYLGGGCAVGKLVAPRLYIPIPLQEQITERK